MADYKLQARVPQETADRLFTVIKELQEVTEVAEVTASSVTRAALDAFIEEHKNQKERNTINIKIRNSVLSMQDLETLTAEIKALAEKTEKGTPIHETYIRIQTTFLIEQMERLKYNRRI